MGLKSASGLEKLLEAIQENVLGKNNIIAQRVVFSKLVQHKGEIVRALLRRLKEASTWCEFGVDTEAMCGAIQKSGPRLEETMCGTVVKHRASYQDHSVLIQLMAGLRSQEWQTRVFQCEGETTLTTAVT